MIPIRELPTRENLSRGNHNKAKTAFNFLSTINNITHECQNFLDVYKSPE